MSVHQVSCNNCLNDERICKILAEDQNIIDIITKNLLNVDKNTYSAHSAQLLANGISITYLPRLEVYSALPPIILRFQPCTNQDSMMNAIDQCFQVYQQSKQLPVILFISSDKLSKPFLDSFVPSESKPYLFYLPNTVWSSKCLLISEQSISQSTCKNENLNELVALSMILLQDKRTIVTLNKLHNPALQYLYDTFKPIFEDNF
ncbi:hypothetical protein AB4K20DRAFT_1890815 [Rhizopus microsporus]|uniref:Uncharacterized protein n=1 Tax=Rhizopus microsporus TaxID=58291 RepID=A0A1X0RJK7_RHIZD|nr:hypothetical protein BCV71DRAFT_100938 [Rhizopus microsporus]